MMNRALATSLIIFALGIGFWAGYIVGTHGQTEVREPAPAPVVEPVIEVAPAPEPEPIEIPEMDDFIDDEDDEDERRWEERAALSEQLFRDPEGRELRAVILDVNAAGFRIRRVVDRREMDLPLSLLSEEDRAFHAYLWDIASAAAPSGSEMPDVEPGFWEQLFQ